MNAKILLILLIFLFYFGSAYAYEINSCGSITQPGYYVLTQNLSSKLTCLSLVDVNNVVIDCQNFTINYANSGNGAGIYLFGTTNIIIKNCNFLQRRNTVAGYGIQADTNIFNVSIINNNFNTSCQNHIFVDNASNILIENNSFYSFNPCWAFGLWFSQSSNITIKNSILTTNNANVACLYIENVDNVSVENFTSSGTYEGILTDNINGTFKDINLSNVGYDGFCIAMWGGNISIKNFTCESTGANARGVDVNYINNYITIENSKFITKGNLADAIAFYLRDDTKFYVFNSTFDSYNLEDIKLINSHGDFVDVNFSTFTILNSYFRKLFSVDVKATYLEGDPIENVTIEAYNNNNELIFNKTTHQDGFIDRQIILEKNVSNYTEYNEINYQPTRFVAIYENYTLEEITNITSPMIRETNSHITFTFPISRPCVVIINVLPQSGSIFEILNINFVCDFENVGSDAESCKFKEVNLIINDSMDNNLLNYSENIDSMNYSLNKSFTFNYSDNYHYVCSATNKRNQTFTSDISFIKIVINVTNYIENIMTLAAIILVVFGASAIFFYLSTKAKNNALVFTFFSLGLLFLFASLVGGIFALNSLGLLNLALENYISTILLVIGILIFLFFIIMIIFIVMSILRVDKKTKKLKELGLVD